MYSYCAAALTATLMMTTGSLAVDGRAPLERPVYAATQVASPNGYADFRDMFEEDDDFAPPARRYYDEDETIVYRRPAPRDQDPRAPYYATPYDDEVEDYGRPPARRFDDREYYPPPRPSSPTERFARPDQRPEVRPNPPTERYVRPEARPTPPNQPRVAALSNDDARPVDRVAPPADGRVHVSVSIARNEMIVINTRGERFRWPVSTAREGYTTLRANNVLVRANPADVNYRSKKYHGSPMPNSLWWKRNKGYAIHGTTAEGELGKPASHGCVRLSRANSRTLFGWVSQAGGAVVNIR